MRIKPSVFLCAALLFAGVKVSAQAKADAAQLVSAENYFAATAKEKGINKSFLAVSDGQTLIFRPGPVKVTEFYKDRAESPGILAWEPVFARIAKSGDWGFTTGPFTYRQSDTSKAVSYGDYLSIWRKNKKGTWKLAVDVGVNHPQPSVKPKLEFLNADDARYVRQYGAKRKQQREDIVMSSDKLYATILKADNKIARKEFLAEEVRLLFPGQQPLIGKSKVSDFWDKQQVKITSEATAVDRAFSGELAYTYGTASIESKGKTTQYHYLRIWEIQPGFNWNVIAEVFSPAGS